MRAPRPSELRTLFFALAVAVSWPGLAARAAETPEDSPSAPAANFASWLDGLRAEALRLGIRARTLDRALEGLAPISRVIELDRSQPEFTLTFEDYLARVVPRERIERGRARLAENRSLLAEIGRRFGVQPRFIVALWGIETDFGRVSGGFEVIPALATLAYDGRRSDYFRGELLDALVILDEGHVALAEMTGSWAGAMGQSQFMPSSFRRYAVDFDGDGRRDIWNTRADVFASAANYLASSGWRDDQTWGRRVSLPNDLDPKLASLDIVKRLAEWQALGIRRADGSDLPTRQLPASLVLPAREGKTESDAPQAIAAEPAYLVYDNYRTTLRWNRSTYFALAVGHLADAIGGR